MIDGHHRLFAARLAGEADVLAEVVAESEAALRLDLPARIGELVRFTVPPQAMLAIANGGVPLSFGHLTRHVEVFPSADAHPEDDLVELLEDRRTAGLAFLLVPSPAFAWMEGRPGLEEHLQRHYRLAADNDLCRIYVLWRSRADERSEASRLARRSPPVEMRHLSTGLESADEYEKRAAATSEWLEKSLEAAGAPLARTTTALDFGCGAGRLLTRLASSTAITALDINPYLIAWVKANIPNVQAAVCPRLPPLNIPDDYWDLILAIDVLTHFDQELHRRWLEEFGRMLKPGGHLVLTLHGTDRRAELLPDAAAAFDAGSLVVTRPERAGTNECAAYHPPEYVEGELTTGFELVLYRRNGALELGQDVVVLRRRDHDAA